MRPRKRFGQHFLHDQGVLQGMADAIRLKTGDRVLEIGPGQGALTDYLYADEGMHYLAIEIDRAAIHGSGSSNQPTGILATSGIGSVAGGTNGAAPTYAHIVGLETQVAQDNADEGALNFLTNSKVRGKLLQTEKASSTAQFVWSDNNSMRGYNAAVSNQVSSTLTKGNQSLSSAIIFGNFNDLLIGMWGGLDIALDNSTGSASGTVRVVALQDVDIAVRHAQSFAAMLDALTA